MFSLALDIDSTIKIKSNAFSYQQGNHKVYSFSNPLKPI